MPTLAPIDDGFFDTAKQSYVHSWDVNLPAAEVWDSLVNDPLRWCRALSITWTSAQPFGVGTTRRVRALGLLVANEYFFAWEEGRRMAFHFTDVNLPLFKRFGEDYVVEPTGPASCRFTWKLAGEPTAIGATGKPVLNGLVSSLFRDTTRHFAASAG